MENVSKNKGIHSDWKEDQVLIVTKERCPNCKQELLERKTLFGKKLYCIYCKSNKQDKND